MSFAGSRRKTIFCPIFLPEHKNVSLQVPFAGRVAAFSALLPAALEKSSNRPDEPLPQLATALVATELRQPGKSAAGLADQHLQALMQFGLHQLQVRTSRVAKIQGERCFSTSDIDCCNALNTVNFVINDE